MVPPDDDLSPRQRAALDMVLRLQQRAGRPPTRAELGRALGVSAQTADFHLRALQRKGWLRLSRLSRGIEGVIDPATDQAVSAGGPAAAGAASAAARIPVVGRVAAGSPLTALENLDGDLPLPDGCHADFALRVIGDSMIEAGILDGDLVLVEGCAEAASGEIVVALVGQGEETEATVKRYLPQRGRIVLRPANSALHDIVVRPEQGFRLAGRVVGVLRLWN